MAGFAVLAVYFTGLFAPFNNPNELSRFQAIYAIAEQGTFRIDDAIRLFGSREDQAFSGGHYYSNKAPGLAFAASPVYRALRLLFPAPANAFAPIFVLLRVLTVSLLYALALVRFVSRVSRFPGSALLVLGLVFGTPLAYYGRSFFAHAWSAALLFLAWDLLRRREERGNSPLLAAAAGFLAGWAAISEYTAAPLALALGIRAAWGSRWRTAVLFAAGGAVPLLLLGAYNAVCFGSPWVLSSAREAESAFAEIASHGVFGFGPPSPRVAWDFLFHPARGLLLSSPFWIWVIPGFAAWWRSGEERADCVFCLASVAGFFLILSGYSNWHGGWALGDRYLIPVAFFAGLVAVRGLGSPLSRGLFSLAVLFSVANGFLLSASWPHFWDLPWPAANGSLWFVQRGWIAPNLLSKLGPWSLVPPAAIVAGTALFALRAARPLSPRPLIAAAGAAGLFAATLLAPREPSYTSRLLRAGVFGRYSGLDPERRELTRVIESAATAEERRRGMVIWRQYGRP